MRISSYASRFICFGVLLLLGACSVSSKQTVNLRQLYQKSAQYHLPDRNPIIVIPGILGSSLIDQQSGKTVWGAFRANYANPNTREGAQLIALSIDTLGDTLDGGHGEETIEHGHDNRQFGYVRPNGVLENLELNLAGFPISIQAYAGILTTLGAGGYRDESLGLNSIDYGTDHFTCFQFDYDWRRDIVYNAKRLDAFIEEKQREVSEQYYKEFGIRKTDIKFDIAAHSMGALLTRYYLRYGAAPLPDDDETAKLTWAGAENVERAILIAPPNAGSLEAFDQLINGFNVGRPLLPHYPPAILGTFPSVYQLLPRARHKAVVWNEDETKSVDNLFDPALWQDMEWGLAGQDDKTQRVLSDILPDVLEAEERRKIATAFQAHALERAEQFQRALDRPAQTPNGLDLYLVAGDATQMAGVMSVNSENGKIDVLRRGIGDKTVLRSSALMDERVGREWKPALQTPIDWTSVLFVPAQHRKITSDPVFEDNVLYWLLEDPRAE